MAKAREATVIFLQSHPAWIAAQREEQARAEAMRRHPSFSPSSARPRRVVATSSLLPGTSRCIPAPIHRPERFARILLASRA